MSARSVRATVRCVLATLAAILALPGLPPPVAAQGEACFAETGQCVQDPFLTYWRTHGGLAIHGFPLSTASPEKLEDGKTYLVQHFERARFELHPELPPEFYVSLTLLGQHFTEGRSEPGFQ